jgi:hypothetical protein
MMVVSRLALAPRLRSAVTTGDHAPGRARFWSLCERPYDYRITVSIYVTGRKCIYHLRGPPDGQASISLRYAIIVESR